MLERSERRNCDRNWRSWQAVSNFINIKTKKPKLKVSNKHLRKLRKQATVIACPMFSASNTSCETKR